MSLSGRFSLKLADIVSDAYALFAPYTIGRTLAVCKACCITDAEEAELVSTPLRQVSRNLLQNAYYESARNYSDQELWEMKHFLPRVLELVSGFEFPCHSTEITFTRLDLNRLDMWQPAEVALLNDFALIFFASCLNSYPLPSGDGLDDILVMFGLAHLDLKPLLLAWENADTAASLQHLAQLLVYGIQDYGRRLPRLTNAFSEAYVDEVVIGWLQAAQVKQKFARQIEALILSDHNLSEEAASKVSWAYDILQQM